MIKFNTLKSSTANTLLPSLMRSLDETPEELFKDVIEDFDDGSIEETHPILHTYWTTLQSLMSSSSYQPWRVLFGPMP